jgi:hypothetical protein
MAHLLIIRNGMMMSQAKAVCNKLNKIPGVVFYLLLAGFSCPRCLIYYMALGVARKTHMAQWC